MIHIIFPRYFNWPQELASLSIINRQMMYVHTFFIAFAVLLLGLLCFSSAGDLVNTPLGQRVSFGAGIFWLTRLLVQFFGYSRELWKGKAKETAIHILLSLLWVYLSTVFLYASFATD